MNAYVKVTGGVAEPYSIERLRAANPNTSFPALPGADLLAGYGVFALKPTVPPAVPTGHYKLVGAAPTFSAGAWWKAWEVAALDPDEVAAWRASASLTFAQFLYGIATEGWFTEAEASAWAEGRPPNYLVQQITALPPSRRFLIKMRAARPDHSIVRRISPLVDMLGKTPEQLDAFFATYTTA